MEAGVSVRCLIVALVTWIPNIIGHRGESKELVASQNQSSLGVLPLSIRSRASLLPIISANERDICYTSES
jgi:hypothetical protein